jgi:hypothetical protein
MREGWQCVRTCSTIKQTALPYALTLVSGSLTLRPVLAAINPPPSQPPLCCYHPSPTARQPSSTLAPPQPPPPPANAPDPPNQMCTGFIEVALIILPIGFIGRHYHSLSPNLSVQQRAVGVVLLLGLYLITNLLLLGGDEVGGAGPAWSCPYQHAPLLGDGEASADPPAAPAASSSLEARPTAASSIPMRPVPLEVFPLASRPSTPALPQRWRCGPHSPHPCLATPSRKKMRRWRASWRIPSACCLWQTEQRALLTSSAGEPLAAAGLQWLQRTLGAGESKAREPVQPLALESVPWHFCALAVTAAAG